MDYPINLKLRGRRVFIIGGGRVAQRRVEALLEAEARITVISPALTDGLAAAAAAGTFSHVAAKYTAGAIAALTAEYGKRPGWSSWPLPMRRQTRWRLMRPTARTFW